MSVQKYICDLLRKTLLKKGSSSNSFPKTFSMKFQPDRAHTIRIKKFKYFLVCPVWLKFVLKVFGRGFGGNLSSERFPPINTYNASIWIFPFGSLIYMYKCNL